MKTFVEFYDKYKKPILVISIIILLALFISPLATTKHVKRNVYYEDVEDVALYLKTYHELPKNYITKSGYEYAIKHGKEYKDLLIGGDTFWNDGSLSSFHIKENIKLKECDLYQRGYTYASRGTHRLVYTTNTNNTRVFVTKDHYESFDELTSFELQLTSNILWICFSIYLLISITFYTLVLVFKGKLMLD